MLRLAVLVSGGGTNLQAIIDNLETGKIRNCELVLVVSNNPKAYALERARKAGIQTEIVTRKKYKEGFDRALLKVMEKHEIDLIVLAGFMSILSAAFVNHYESRIINVHPSLIPSFCGRGFYGIIPHEKALERGVKLTGATVHFVDQGADEGPIILQKCVEVRDDDTPESLQRRVMEEAEWVILPKAIDLLCSGKIRVNDGKVQIIGG